MKISYAITVCNEHKEIEKLYQKRADHFYVTAVLGKMASPATTPKYSIQKFMKG